MNLFVIRGPLPTTPDGRELGTEEEAQDYLDRWLGPVAEFWESLHKTPRAKVIK